MKTRGKTGQGSRRKSGFTIVLYVIVLLIFVTAVIAANTTAMNRLDREVRGMEKHQKDRLNRVATVNKSPTLKR